MNKYIKIGKDNDILRLSIKGRAKTAPEVSDIVDKTFEELGLSQFDKTVFLAIDDLMEEKKQKNFPRVIIEGMERPLPFEDGNPIFQYKMSCEITFLELYRKVMNDPSKSVVSADDLKPIEDSLDRLSNTFIGTDYSLSANHILWEIFEGRDKEKKSISFTETFLPVKSWHIPSKFGWELGFISTTSHTVPPLHNFVTLAECAYEKRGGIEFDAWDEYKKTQQVTV